MCGRKLRKKINITIDEDLLSNLKEEVKEKKTNLSRLIESKLLEANESDLEARVKKIENVIYGNSEKLEVKTNEN